jgi:ABC-type nitrate/sulfonate/bicarbonate transport system substrate-binding protein
MTDRSKGKNVKRACFFDRLVLVPAVVIYFTLSSLVVRAAALERVNASYGAISGSMAQTWVAKEARLYEKYGLDLNLVYISGGPRSIMSLIGGSVQFVNHSGMPALEAYQRGADTALIASPLNQLDHGKIFLPGSKDNLTHFDVSRILETWKFLRVFNGFEQALFA